jgi:hypothetical protein
MELFGVLQASRMMIGRQSPMCLSLACGVQRRVGRCAAARQGCGACASPGSEHPAVPAHSELVSLIAPSRDWWGCVRLNCVARLLPAGFIPVWVRQTAAENPHTIF